MVIFAGTSATARAFYQLAQLRCLIGSEKDLICVLESLWSLVIVFARQVLSLDCNLGGDKEVV